MRGPQERREVAFDVDFVLTVLFPLNDLYGRDQGAQGLVHLALFGRVGRAVEASQQLFDRPATTPS